MTTDPASIRRFLIQFFSDEELNTLAFDYFPLVYNDFTGGMTKSQKARLVVDYSARRGRLPDLLSALARERPALYEEWLGASVPALPDASGAAARDPRQVFISHAHPDAEFAQRVAEGLAARGWRVWLAPDSIRPGEKWVEAINRGMQESGVFVLVLTEAAAASRWVRSETNIAVQWEHQGQVRFIPVRPAAEEPPDMPPLWQGYQQVPFAGGFDRGMAALLGALAPEPEPPAAAEPAPQNAPPARARRSVPRWAWAIALLAAVAIIAWAAVTLPERQMANASDTTASTPGLAPGATPGPTLDVASGPTSGAASDSSVAEGASAGNTPAPATPAAGSTRARPADAMAMVWVPGGSFPMGSVDGDDDEQPVHEVTLDGFWIDRTEVSNKQYARCVSAGDCAPAPFADGESLGGEDLPVVGVDWEGAAGYCQWVGARLPTEAEWEYAARGPDAPTYPWGEEAPSCELLQFAACDGDTAPVGSHPAGASWVGAEDMSGNVWEWVSDWYDFDFYAHSPAANPSGPVGEGEKKVLRGGSFTNSGKFLRATDRGNVDPSRRETNYGFRCAQDDDAGQDNNQPPGATAAGAVAEAGAAMTPSAAAPEAPTAGAAWLRAAGDSIMLWVPPGAFPMGSEGVEEDEQPPHVVTIGGFWIEQTEVTNAQYARCVSGTTVGFRCALD